MDLALNNLQKSSQPTNLVFHSFFQLSSKIQVFIYLFAFFYFPCGLLEQNPLDDNSFLLVH